MHQTRIKRIVRSKGVPSIRYGMLQPGGIKQKGEFFVHRTVK